MTECYTLTRRVVRAHNHENDAWVIVRGGVYDVTGFLRYHPGGRDVLLKRLGEDVTSVMNGELKGGHEHSSAAYKILQQYYVGPLADADASPAEAAALDGTLDEHGRPLVDFSKPLLDQVGKLGDKYHRWVHSFPTSDHHVALFANPTLESLTKCPWYVPLVFWIPIFVCGLWFVFARLGCSFVRDFLPFTTFGYIFWMFFEYLLHRYVFHVRTGTYWSNIFHFLIHGHHHLAPMDYDRLVFPPIPAALVSMPVWLTAPRVFGLVRGLCFLFGFGVGYLQYDMTHFLVHYGTLRTGFLAAQKRRHMIHHFKAPGANFGISVPVLDIVFGTLHR
ncbi:similar to fatty acid hydroxylase [Cyanidioschyzon merolae strain 10D]|jgi:4-hydroxysphinganine ceramide fatty acyl 2-hydroxylase|uniref:Fatty acid 2-hydroxylase n=1 Tax=Cyanidioschyzon merolae (strain NIES-3377 / 10D) TaxID=280699 RepID=M1VJW0_CYAM1|nr:similar to fatty acid hydroxylase [Cyanidioschyzon merolae strain 10D]BAM81668.1 similar to fatty acid hydroxylase [Cyanidioschyzon merolae strain 10D]|eukprot:XP_005537704.1 similar to fatty acid hydroxylase [Cyanidioschyzon merolae strain 10D]